MTVLERVGGFSVVRAVRHVIKPLELRDQFPAIEHGPEELPLGTVVVDPADSDRVLLAYLPFEPVEERDLRLRLSELKITAGARTLGLQARSTTFGAVPRLEVRGRDTCRVASLNTEHPEAYRLLAAQAPAMEALYERLAPGVFEAHSAEAAGIDDAWRLPGSRAFTGGVVNRDSNLGYHFDSGNFTQVFSAMLGLRRGVTGGALVLPELGMHLPIADKSVTFFDGQSLLHGVTAMSKQTRRAYRITTVFYSTKRLWHCLPPSEELERGKAKRTERAKRRAGLIP